METLFCVIPTQLVASVAEVHVLAHTLEFVCGFNIQAYALPQTVAAVAAVQVVPWMVDAAATAVTTAPGV